MGRIVARFPNLRLGVEARFRAGAVRSRCASPDRTTMRVACLAAVVARPAPVTRRCAAALWHVYILERVPAQRVKMPGARQTAQLPLQVLVHSHLRTRNIFACKELPRKSAEIQCRKITTIASTHRRWEKRSQVRFSFPHPGDAVRDVLGRPVVRRSRGWAAHDKRTRYVRT